MKGGKQQQQHQQTSGFKADGCLLMCCTFTFAGLSCDTAREGNNVVMNIHDAGFRGDGGGAAVAVHGAGVETHLQRRRRRVSGLLTWCGKERTWGEVNPVHVTRARRGTTRHEPA